MKIRIANVRNVVHKVALAGACLAAFTAVPAWADVKDGVDAWSIGDYARAVAEWQGPAEAGDPDALFNLAQAYRLGRGVDADIDRAKDLYSRAAQRGHVKAADNYGLLLFQQGEQETAMPFISAAAERGDPRAQYVLGLAHFNADYADKDWTKAYAYLTLAQSAGLPQASNALGQMDQYVPEEQRQAAQSLARQMESDANQRRAAELAAADLAARPQPAPAATERPTRVASARGTTPRVTSRASFTPASDAAKREIPVADGIWRVQLGAFGVAGNADRLWSKLAQTSALAGKSKKLVPAGRVTKLQATGFATHAEAQNACAALKQQGQGCLVTKG